MSTINRVFSAWLVYVNTQIQLNNRQGRSSTFDLYEFRFNSFNPTLAMNRSFFVM